MKKIFLLLLTGLIFSCSSDDDSYSGGDDPVPNASVVRILQVNAVTDQVTLSNFGTTSVDVGSYWLCLGPGTYAQIADIATGSTTLSANQSITVSYEMNDAADGLGLFSTNSFQSTDPNVLLDYMQWGAPNQARVGQAVTAGRWDSATSFIVGDSPFTFTGEADEFGASFWEATVTESRVIRILEVNADTNEIVLSNFGNVSVDVADYWLCLGPGNYAQISNIASGSTNLSPNQEVTLTFNLSPISEGLGIFTTNTFGSTDPDVLLDYVQWGAPNQDRVNQAVTAGRWDSAANFVADGSPYNFTGGADDFGVSFWEGTVVESRVIRISEVNAITDQVVLSNFGNVNVDVGSYWLCLGPGTYAQVSNVATGSTDLAPNESITLTYDVNPTADGLSIFTTNTFGSSDPDVLIDFVQWGAGNQPRVDQAVTAGRWDNAANFVADGSPYTFTGNSEEFGSQFWGGTPQAGVVRILQVNATTNQVVLSNFGNASIDVGSYWLCLGPGTYAQVSNVATTSTNLAPNESVTLSYNMDEVSDGLSIFSTNSFSSSDPDILLDYVQWGAADQARVSQAVTAGRWDDANNFVTGGSPYDFTGGASDVGVSFWE